MAQSIRPDGDISTGTWTTTPLWSKIEEVTPSDADFVQSANDPANDTFEVSLDNPGGDPDTGTGTVRIRASKGQSGGGSPGTINLTVALYEGATVRQSATAIGSNIPVGFAEYTATITSGNMATVTDWTDVRLRFDADKASGARTSWAELSHAVFEIPNAAGGAARRIMVIS
jgi:hypothetical protein